MDPPSSSINFPLQKFGMKPSILKLAHPSYNLFLKNTLDTRKIIKDSKIFTVFKIKPYFFYLYGEFDVGIIFSPNDIFGQNI